MKTLWHPIRKDMPRDEILLVDFGSGDRYPTGIKMVMVGLMGFYEEDEGNWKGMGSAADDNAKRWCRLDDAIEIIATM